MELPVSYYGTVGTGGCLPKRFLIWLQTVSEYGTVGKGVAIQFINREPFEPPVSKYGTAGTGGCKQLPNNQLLEPGGRGLQAFSK